MSVTTKKKKVHRVRTNHIGKNIKMARVEADLNQTELAHRIGVKQKSISRYETGASLPTIKTLMKISKVLAKKSGFFLDGSLMEAKGA